MKSLSPNRLSIAFEPMRFWTGSDDLNADNRKRYYYVCYTRDLLNYWIDDKNNIFKLAMAT